MCLYLDLNTEIPYVSYFFSLLYIPTPTACCTECTQTSVSVLYSPMQSWQYVCPHPRSKQCELTHTSTDIVVCFLNWWILHIYFKPNCTNGRVGVTAVRCGHRIQTNCRDISFTHSQRWHCCGEIKWWHLCWRTCGEETTSPLGMRQDYRDRSELKWKHQLLVYPDVWWGKTCTT